MTGSVGKEGREERRGKRGKRGRREGWGLIVFPSSKSGLLIRMDHGNYSNSVAGSVILMNIGKEVDFSARNLGIYLLWRSQYENDVCSGGETAVGCMMMRS